MDHLAHEPCLLAGSFQLLRWMQYSYALMMEQADSRKCHHHAVLIAGFDHLVIPDRASRLCYIFYTAFISPVNIISEGEESVRAKSYVRKAVQPCPLFLFCKYRGFSLKMRSHLPSASTSI